MTGQLVALLRLRASTLSRSERSRVAVALAAMPLLAVLVVVTGASVSQNLGPDSRSEVVLLLPTAFLAFAVAALVAAVASSGGRELLPRSQLAAFPVSPASDYAGAAVLAPLNLAWALQTLALLGLVAAAVGWTAGVLAAVVTTLAWLGAATLVAQALAWAVELVRTYPGGVWLVRAGGGGVAVAALALSASGMLIPLLDASPTLRVVVQALRGAGGEWLPWLRGLGELAVVAGAAVLVGTRLSSVVAHRPRKDHGRVEARGYPARPATRSDVLAALRVDRASVWRSAPLRRGLLVLALVPGASAALARLPWELMPMLPGLVTSGAALLFGVNAFALDAAGAVWRESLPDRSGAWFAARALVIAEVAAGACLLAMAVAVARAPALPTASAATAVAVAVVVVSAQVLARSLTWSLQRPYRSDLRTARDAPAPPATMAWYSTRLALATTATGLLLSLAARADSPVWAMAVGLPLLLFALRRLVACGRLWERPEVRSRVLTTVARG